MSARQRKLKIERMEACDVPHKSRDGDLRATFRADQSENADEPTVNPATSPGLALQMHDYHLLQQFLPRQSIGRLVVTE